MFGIMPTPATHLASAQAMLHRGTLRTAARELLSRHTGPFVLGHTAPDVTTISGQRREASHFYSIPRTSNRPAYQVLLDTHPALVDVTRLSPAQAAFVAGYIAHLLLDELWLVDVFQPCFLQEWGPLAERMFLHNVLRTWVDGDDQARLNDTVSQALQQAEPDNWVSFIEDGHLRLWRDWLVEQLAPDHKMETAEVLASRVGVPAEEMETVAQSPEQMENRVFCHFSRSALRRFREKGQRDSTELVNWYIETLTSRDHPWAATKLPSRWSANPRAKKEILT